MSERKRTGRSGGDITSAQKMWAAARSLARIVWLPLLIYLALSLLQAGLQQRLAPETREVQQCWTDGIAFTTTLRLLHPAVLRREETSRAVIASFTSQTLPAGASCAMLPAPGAPFTVSLSASPAVLLVDSRQEPLLHAVMARVGPGSDSTLVVWARHAGLESPNDASVGFVHVVLAGAARTVDSQPILLESRADYFWRLVATSALSPGGLLLALAAFVVQWSAEQERKRREDEERRDLENIERTLQTSSTGTVLAEGLISRWIEALAKCRIDRASRSGLARSVAEQLMKDFEQGPAQLLASPNLLTEVKALVGTDVPEMSDLAKLIVWWQGGERPSDDWSSPFMAGFYHNLAAVQSQKGSDLTRNQQADQNAIEPPQGVTDKTSDLRWKQWADQNPKDFLRGALACRRARTENIGKRDPNIDTAPDLISQMASLEFRGKEKDKENDSLHEFIKRSCSGDTDALTSLCCWLTQQWRIRSDQQSAQTARPRARLLWPLNSSQGPKIPEDANYDFDVEMEWKQSPEGRPSELVKGFDPARVMDLVDKINAPAVNKHFLVVGERGTGKTALRLYLEYLCQTTGDTLPLFYFAPRALVDDCALSVQVRHLAACLGNELFARLCETDGQLLHANQSPRLSEQEEDVIAHFLKQYGYRVPSPGESLFWPVPSADRTDVDRMCRQIFPGTFHERMRNMIDSLPAVGSHVDATPPERVCSDMVWAIAAARFERAVVLVDNMDDALRYTPAHVFANVIAALLEEDEMLAQHRIFVIAFVPPAVREALPESIVSRLASQAQTDDGRLTLFHLR